MSLSFIAGLAAKAPAAPAPRYAAEALDSPTPEAEQTSGFGQLVAPVGDVDGDRVGDVLIANPHQAVGGTPNVGRAWIFSGRTRALLHTLDLPDALEPGETGVFFGLSGASLGDVSGDGVPDVAIGAPGLDVYVGPGPPCGTPETRNPPAPNGCDENQGRVYVFSGATGGLIRTVPYPSSQSDPASFVSDPANFGRALIGPGDLNGDGVPDLVATASEENLADASAPDRVDHSSGALYAFSGADGRPLYHVVNPEPYPGTGGRFGLGLAGPGDVTRDGIDDLLVGTPFYPIAGTGQATAGRAYLIDGKTGQPLLTLKHPQSASADSVASLFGLMAGQRGAPGDVDGDGVPDLFVPAPRQGIGGVRKGRGYLFSGKTGELIRALDPPTPQSGGEFGFSYAPAGDLDRDGRPDLLVGQLADDELGATTCGGAYVFSGAGGLLERLEQSPPGAGGADWVGSPGDLNADGQPDYVVGGTLTDVGTTHNQGRALFYLSGAATAPRAGPPAGCIAQAAAPQQRAAPKQAPPLAFPGCPASSANVIQGTPAANTLTGSPTGDRIFAEAGADVVDGRAGDDCIDLGLGDDRALGSLGSDLVLGGPGRDRLDGGPGDDRLFGGAGSDRLGGGSGADRIYGQGGNDRIVGGPGEDRAFGGAGRDRISGGAGRDSLYGGPGRDRIKGGPGADGMAGGSGSDRMDARDGRRDRISCGRGRDRVLADSVDRVGHDCEQVRRRPHG